IVVAAAWDALGIDTGPHQYHLTISALAQAYRPLNAALLLVWILGGIGYGAARSRRTTAASTDTAAGASDAAAGLRRTAGGHAVALVGLPGLVAHTGAAAGATAGPALLLPSSPPVGVAFWVAVPVAAVVIEMAARHSSGARATAAEFVRFISNASWGNVAL